MSATPIHAEARPGVRTDRATRRGPALRVVERPPLSPRIRRRRAAVVGALLTVMVFGCLLALAVVQTMLVQSQLRLDGLAAEVEAEQQRFDRLRLRVAELEAPERIVAEARERLGMVPAGHVTYVTPSADAATRAAAPSAVAGTPPPPGPSDARSWATVKPYLGLTP